MRSAVIVVFAACSSPSAPTQKKAPATPPASSAIDDVMRGYAQKLPEPTTLSESNGASLLCAPGQYDTYTHLYALGHGLPIKQDSDLLALVPWASHANPCIRDIAVQAIVERIGFDRNRLVAPNLHDPENHLFHEIMVALRAYLGARHIDMTGTWLSFAPTDMQRLRGSWIEDTGGSKNFQLLVDISGTTMKVTTHTVHPDPSFPDRTEDVPLAKLSVNAERGMFVIPADGQTYWLMPVTDQAIWIDNGREYWDLLRRK